MRLSLQFYEGSALLKRVLFDVHGHPKSVLYATSRRSLFHQCVPRPFAVLRTFLHSRDPKSHCCLAVHSNNWSSRLRIFHRVPVSFDPSESVCCIFKTMPILKVYARAPPPQPPNKNIYFVFHACNEHDCELKGYKIIFVKIVIMKL